MQIHSLAVAAYLLATSTSAFISTFISNTPLATIHQRETLRRRRNLTRTNHPHLSKPHPPPEPPPPFSLLTLEDNDETAPEYLTYSTCSHTTTSSSSLVECEANLKLDQDDHNPPIKSLLGRFGFHKSFDDAGLELSLLLYFLKCCNFCSFDN